MKLIGNKIRNIALILAILFSIVVCTSSCFPGLSDWVYYGLPNGLEIWRCNSESIECTRAGGSGIILESYITAFCYNENYAGFKHVPYDYTTSDLWIEDVDLSNPDYYLYDAATDTLYGPYTPDEYDEQLEILNISEIGEWIPTVPRPDGAVS